MFMMLGQTVRLKKTTAKRTLLFFFNAAFIRIVWNTATYWQCNFS